MATDLGETFGYLKCGTDRTYSRIEALDGSKLRSLCQGHGATLREREDGRSPCIERVVAPDGQLAPAIGSVADAIDAVFEEALASNHLA